MNLQTRIVVGMLCVAVLAVATGSVLLLGYALAGVMFVLIIALMIRRLGTTSRGSPKSATRRTVARVSPGIKGSGWTSGRCLSVCGAAGS